MHRLVEITAFRNEQGNCWTSVLPAALKRGDTVGGTGSSLMLFEDDTALGPGRSTHDVIRKVGRGAFSHWGQELWFSTSDNTSPTANRRRYVVVAEGSDKDRSSVPTSVDTDDSAPVNYQALDAPVNYQALDATADSIERDATYAIATAQSYIDCLPGGRPYLNGKSVLELGPGPNFGAALVLLCWGAAHVAVADRFLVPFASTYHLPLYRRLRELLIERERAKSLDPISEVINREQHHAAGLAAYAAPLEDLAKVVDKSFDVTTSNAVFEHLFNPRAATRSLHELTTSGGIGLHQVDFRDHRDFSRPLEFLLDDERSFALLFDREFGQTGSRVRPFQMEAMFRAAGFCSVEFQANLLTEKAYLDDFVPRLRRCSSSPFCLIDVTNLSEVSGRFVVRK